MPFIQVKGIESTMTSDQKQMMIERLTDALLSVTGEHLRPMVVVIIEEVKSGDWGIGGKPLTTEDVKALMAVSQ